MKKETIYTLSAILLLTAGCNKENFSGPGQETDRVTFRVSTRNMAGAPDSDSAIHGISAFRFKDGILVEKFEGMDLSPEGTFDMHFPERKGTLIFWANAEQIISGSAFTENVTTQEEFMSHTATAGQMTEGGLTMTAQTQLASTGSEILLSMKRSVARIDLDSSFGDTRVRKVTVRGISDRGYVNDRGAEGLTSDRAEAVRDYSDAPYNGGTETLFYLAAQPDGQYGDGYIVEIEASVNGAWRKLSATLPRIRRNTVYTLKVYGNGADMGISVTDDEWESGNGTSAGQIMKGIVDMEASVFSDGVRVNETRDTVFLPYLGSDLTLALKAEAGTEVEIKGSIRGVEISPLQTRSLTPLASFSISSAVRFPGRKDEFIYLDILSGNIRKGRVVVVAEANPVGLSGKIVLDENGSCDFGRYIDGELGIMTLPEGRTASLRFPEPEKEWMRLFPLSENTFRIDGGWKPNDPEADGRTQTVEIVITDTDGTHPEVYTVKRRNHGLPVVNFNGTWWCKYNLRGNSRSFEDQISIADDPAKDGNLADYLKTCSDEEFALMAGDQYQGGQPQGLRIIQTDGKFSYEGYNTANKTDFGTIDPESMTPDGYRIPEYSHYRFFTWNENANLGYGSNVFNNGLGQRINYTITERDITIGGVSYGVMNTYDFIFEGRHIVMMGFGHQYNATDIAPRSIIFATYGRSGMSWMLEGYSRAEGRGNWYKFAAHNPQKTRIIRCIKTPVEYIYE